MPSKYFSWSSPQESSLIFNETPAGAIDGLNDVFTLAFAPNPSGNLMLYKDGMLQRQGAGNDYTISGSTITFEPGNVPQLDNILLAMYQK